MNKQEALEIYLKAHDECLKHGCKECPFREIFESTPICLLHQTVSGVVAKCVRKKLECMGEKQEVKPSVPLENLKATTTLYVKSTLSVEELEKQLKALLPKKLALEPLPKEDRAIKMPESSKPDNVNHPKHYCKGGIECIDAIRAAVSDLQGIEAVYAGKVIKYVWRFKGKNGLEDLKKAKRCLEWLIEEVEKNANKTQSVLR